MARTYTHTRTHTCTHRHRCMCSGDTYDGCIYIYIYVAKGRRMMPAVLFRFGGVVGAIQDGAGWRMMCA